MKLKKNLLSFDMSKQHFPNTDHKNIKRATQP
jgi:hypothetical protein